MFSLTCAKVNNSFSNDKTNDLSYFLTILSPLFFIQALGYGLSLPLYELDILRDCVGVYCHWLTALLPGPPRPEIPLPIVADPDHYACVIISHLHAVFVPRHGEGWIFIVTFLLILELLFWKDFQAKILEGYYLAPACCVCAQVW